MAFVPPPIGNANRPTEKLCSGNYRRIARLSGLSLSHVKRSLTGQRGLTLYTAHLIAKAAKVSLDQLWHFIQHEAQARDTEFGRRTKTFINRRRRLAHERELRRRSNPFIQNAYKITPMPVSPGRGAEVLDDET